MFKEFVDGTKITRRPHELGKIFKTTFRFDRVFGLELFDVSRTLQRGFDNGCRALVDEQREFVDDFKELFNSL